MVCVAVRKIGGGYTVAHIGACCNGLIFPVSRRGIRNLDRVVMCVFGYRIFGTAFFVMLSHEL